MSLLAIDSGKQNYPTGVGLWGSCIWGSSYLQFGPIKTPPDLSERLPTFNRPLYEQVKAVLEVNKAQRHIRGGLATRKKYKGI